MEPEERRRLQDRHDRAVLSAAAPLRNRRAGGWPIQVRFWLEWGFSEFGCPISRVLCEKWGFFGSPSYCSFSPAVNTVHGPAFMSRKSGFCQEYSGCRSRNSAAEKSAPHGCPARATKLIFSAIALSPAFPCTAPPGLYASQAHSFTPRGEASTCPHSPRSFSSSFFSTVSKWSDKNCSARATSIFPLECRINCSHRAFLAFGDDDASFGSNVVSSLINFGSRAKFELMKYPSFVRHSGVFFSPSSR